MTASRWNSTIAEIMRWDAEEQEELNRLLLAPILTHVNPKEEEAGESQTEPTEEGKGKIPDELPILPLRGMVVYPETAVPLTIGQPRSIRLVDDVVSGERLIGLVAAHDPEMENPGPENLYNTGTVATIHRLFRAPDGTIRLLVQGMARFKLGKFTQTDPYLKAKIQLIPETVETGIEIEALARNARDQFEHIAEMIPSIPRGLITPIS
ncbi:MAG: LON peptidase substrate-binding domain-containing protein, partial [Chloroflexi bacterium]|nr:LON peptidase substrate-binding domain-containing protein [Chloroflexota bacterium]